MWDYRIMRRVENGEPVFGIHEVFYDDDGRVERWTESPVAPDGEGAASLDELRRDFEAQRRAFDLPPLDFETGAEPAPETRSGSRYINGPTEKG